MRAVGVATLNANSVKKQSINAKSEPSKCSGLAISRLTLDCTLTYKPHIRKVAAKTRTRNNLVHMLAGTTWGAGAKTIRTSALALCYSVAEYCAPVWRNSAHTNLVDVQLNNTIRTITGAVRCTRTDWLPVLSNIAPAEEEEEEETLFDPKSANVQCITLS